MIHQLREEGLSISAIARIRLRKNAWEGRMD